MDLRSRLRVRHLVVAFGLLIAAAAAALAVGAADIPLRGVVLELVDRLPFGSVESGLSDRQATILWELRLPRIVLAGLVGGVLAMAGGAYQGVFRNPLADPYLLGVAAGAGLGATIVIVAGDLPRGAIPVAAFGGAIVAVVATYLLGATAGGRRSAVTLILAGVAVASFLTALQTFVQQRNADTVREVFAWILGGLTTVGWGEVWVVLPYAGVSAVVILLHRRLLDVLAVGEEEAGTLGVNPARVRIVVVLAATLGTAAAVAVAGLIAFVGIIVPHTIRLMVGPSYRRVIPLTIIGGAAFLILADLVARTILTPAELPLGVVTAFVGGPFFVLVLRSAREVA